MENEYEVHNDLKIPIVYVTRNKQTGFCKFFCRYCRKNHNHGKGDGHRVAHCYEQDSPYHKTGYILKTKEGVKGRIYGDWVRITLFNFNTLTQEVKILNKDSTYEDLQLTDKILDSYDYKNYGQTVIECMKLFGIYDNDILLDCQSEGNGIPDFEIRKRNMFIEFKSSGDALRMNQLYKFIELSKKYQVYVIHVERGENGATNTN